MRPAAPPLLLLLPLLLAAARSTHAADNTTISATTQNDDKNDTLEAITLANGTIVHIDPANGTLDDSEDEHEPVVRKKRTFGDIVFRGLADVLGYNIQRKPPQAATFPPPVAPVPGIDTPLQAAPAPAAPAPPPCGAPRAAGPPPCRAKAPPPPPPPPPPKPPCPQPRAVPKPKPRPPPPPPPPPPCPKPRANPATPAPCAPAPPPPPKLQADSNLETISSNFQLNFNFVRSTPAPAGQAEAEAEAEVENEQAWVAPIAIEPKAARLPLEQPRQPRVYVDAFVVKNGVPQKVNTVDAKAFNANAQRRITDDDYLAYDDDETQQVDDDYEDVQESRDQTIQQFGAAVDQFWRKKNKQAKVNLPQDHYQSVHFGERELSNQIRRNGGRESHQSLQRDNGNRNTIHLPLPEAEDDTEATTTTEDPRQPLKPRVLPPTEHNPGHIDTVTVRVPPIYKEKRPRKLHREHPGRPDRDEYGSHESIDEEEEHQSYRQASAEENTVPYYGTEAPIRRRRRRKQSRKVRSAEQTEQTEDGDVEIFSYDDVDYFGRKLPISKEEEFYRSLTIPPPTIDPDRVRIEKEETGNGHFLEDHERLRENSERTDNSGQLKKSGRSDKSRRLDDSGRADDSGRSDDSGRTDDSGRFNTKKRSSKSKKRSENQLQEESQRSDQLSPNARVHETGYRTNFVRAKNVRLHNPNPLAS